MRCKTCDYPLWNLKGRQCPECGTAFLPSQFEFVINSVRFCCPHCEQMYYGTSEHGHLVPQAFTCVKCQQPIEMDGMVLRPAEGVREEQTQINRMPWLERKQRGWIKAWLATVRDSMIRPTALISSVPPESGLGPAWGYAILTTLILLMVGAGVPTAIISCIMALTGSNDPLEPIIGGAFIVGGGVIGIIIIVAIWAASAHGILRLTGKTTGTIGRTYECFLYSVGTLAPLAVPCLGPYCGGWIMWVWWLACAAIMLTVAQGVSGWRAALAAATLPLATALITAIGYGVLMYALINSGGFRSATGSVSAEIRMITVQLQADALVNNGNGPTHAIELIESGFSASGFASPWTATDPAKVMLGQTALNQFDFLPDNRRAMAIQAVVAQQPANVIAHRCGDFVFTYHGIDFSNADPNLWVVIFSPDPDAAAALGTVTTPTGPFSPAVGRADGTVRTIGQNFANDLAAQNQLRAQFNLPPLPDPATITHAQPAVGTAPPPADSP